MATVMIAWELGGGFGHTGMLAPLISELMKRGHRVVATLRDVSRTHLVWPQLEPILVQAPIRVRPAEDRYEPPSTFAHILHNMSTMLVCIPILPCQGLSGIRPGVLLSDYWSPCLSCWRFSKRGGVPSSVGSTGRV